MGTATNRHCLVPKYGRRGQQLKPGVLTRAPNIVFFWDKVKCKPSHSMGGLKSGKLKTRQRTRLREDINILRKPETAYAHADSLETKWRQQDMDDFR